MNKEIEPTARSTELMPFGGSMRDWAEELVARAQAEGVELTGDGGLLTGLIKQVLQTGLEAEMSEHLGYEAHDPVGRGTGTRVTATPRNASRPRSVKSTYRSRGTATPASSRS